MNGISLKRATALILIICLAITMAGAPVSAASFIDTRNHWAEKEILRSASAGIVSGYNGRFRPNDNVTRAQFAIMIVNALGLENEAMALKNIPTGYVDLNSSHYAAGHIMVARERGFISGYPEGTYRPERSIRRDEITSILVRALGLTARVGDIEELNRFEDAGEIPEWAKPSVNQAVKLGLVSGFPDSTFRAARSASRGETAVLINKLLTELNRGYTFVGELEKIFPTVREMVIKVSGQTDRYNYYADTSFYYQNTKINPEDLDEGDKVALIIDNAGRLNYIEKLDEAQAAGGLLPNAGGSSRPQALTLQHSPVALDSENRPQAADNDETRVLVSTREGQAAQVKQFIEKAGGQVELYYPQLNYLTASMHPEKLDSLTGVAGVDSINIDREHRVVPLAVMENSSTPGIDPQKSLAVTKSVISADIFSEMKAVDGKGQIIAVMDTGIDPGHPDLQKTSDGKPKIVTWKDFTGEGLVDTKATVRPGRGLVSLVDGNYRVGSIVSKNETFRYGYIREDVLATESGRGMDLNFNGSETDVFAVLLVDSETPGKYDTVYVDTNMNRDFTDETALKVFDVKQDYASFTSRDGKSMFNFNVLSIKADGMEIQFGFDGNDHGSHVAGIIAANGKARGVASGAQLMALKVLDSDGWGSWSSISEAMIYAAANGAKVINLSLGFKPDDFYGGSVSAKLINSLTREYGVIFVVAAGNAGPGLSSVTTPADADLALSVGGVASSSMWKTDYGWEVPFDNIRIFSGVGPRGDGSFYPRVVAPGSAVSTVPMRKGEEYFLSEGTSMAAPHVSGGLALLMEAADKSRIKVEPQVFKRAIELGANPINNYTFNEQGYGVVNLVTSWRELQLLQDNPPYSSTVYSSVIGLGAGIFEQRYNPGRISWYLRNDSERAKNMAVYTHVDWIDENVDSILLPPGQTREIPLRFNLPDKAGLYSAIVRADDQRTYGVDVDFLATIIRPYKLDSQNGGSLTLTEYLHPGQYRRYFYEMQPGTGRLDVSLEVPRETGGAYKGKVRMFLFDPDGQKKAETLFAGDDTQGKAVVKAEVAAPKAGVWEVVVYSSGGLSSMGLDSSQFSLKASATDFADPSLGPAARDIIVSVVPREVPASRNTFVTLQVRNRQDKRPFQGALEIDGKLYDTRKGFITFEVKAGQMEYNYKVRTITDINRYKPLEYVFNLKSGG